MAARTHAKAPTHPTTFSFRQLEELWIAAGGKRVDAVYAAAIALAESSGNPHASNHNTDGSTDRGLWQINSVHGSLSTFNIMDNAKAAVRIHNESGWGPWSTFKNGAYQQFLTPSTVRTGIKQHEGIQPRGVLSQGLEGVVGAWETFGFGAAANAGAKAIGAKTGQEVIGETVAEGETKAEKPLEELGPPDWVKLVITGVLLLAGAFLVVYGIMVAVRPRESALSLPTPKAIPVPV